VPRRLTEQELHGYDVLPRPLAERVRVVSVPVLVPGTSGMTLGRFVLLVGDTDRDGTRKLLAHELVHVRQWHELGTPRFLVRYLTGYLRGLVRHRRHRRAYRAIPLEIEAYALADAWESTRRARARSHPDPSEPPR
jgi:hypothetical protein